MPRVNFLLDPFDMSCHRQLIGLSQLGQWQNVHPDNILWCRNTDGFIPNHMAYYDWRHQRWSIVAPRAHTTWLTEGMRRVATTTTACWYFCPRSSRRWTGRLVILVTVFWGEWQFFTFWWFMFTVAQPHAVIPFSFVAPVLFSFRFCQGTSHVQMLLTYSGRIELGFGWSFRYIVNLLLPFYFWNRNGLISPLSFCGLTGAPNGDY